MLEAIGEPNETCGVPVQLSTCFEVLFDSTQSVASLCRQG